MFRFRISLGIVLSAIVSYGSVSGQPSAKRPPIDRYGDPLPDGAIKRLGTTRLRHLAQVRQLVFAANDKRLLSLGEDGVLSIWDAATGKELKRLSWADAKADHSQDGLALDQRALFLGLPGYGIPRDGRASLSLDGKFLAISRDDTVRVIDPQTGKQIHQLTLKNGKTQAIEISPDGTLLARFAIGQDRQTELVVVETATGKERFKLRARQRFMTNLSFSMDNKFFAALDNNNQVSLWDLASGKRVRLYDSHEGGVNGLLFMPDDNKLATAATDAVCFWDRTTDEPIATFPLDEVYYGAAALSPDGKTLATGGKNGSILLWDVAKQVPKNVFAGNNVAVAALAFSRDGKTLASGTVHGQIHLWNVATGRDVTPVAHVPQLRPIGYVGRGAILVHGEQIETLQHLDDKTGDTLATFPGPSDSHAGVAVAPTGRFLAINDAEKPIVKLWDMSTNKEWRRLEGHAGRINRAVFSADAARLATLCAEDRSLRVWATDSGKELHCLKLPAEVVQREQVVLFRGGGGFQAVSSTSFQEFAFSPDRRVLVYIASDLSAYSWELTTGKLRGRFPVGARNARLLQIAANGRLAAVANEDTIRVLDLVHGTTVHGFVSRYGDVCNLAFSPNSQWLAAGFSTGAVVLYDLAAGRDKRLYLGHVGAIQKIFFDDEGNTLVSTAADGTMLFWDVHAAPLAEKIAKGPDDARLAALWMQLGDTDAGALEAISELTRHPGLAVKFLHAKLKPASPIAADRVRQLVAQLDHANFSVREKAVVELTKLGEQTTPVLRKGRAASVSTEKSRRIDKVLESLAEQRTTAKNIRLARAVETLERIGNQEANALLHILAAGAPDALLTAEAAEAIQRLQRNR